MTPAQILFHGNGFLGGKMGQNSIVVSSLGFHTSASPDASFRSLTLSKFVEGDSEDGGRMLLQTSITSYQMTW
jgi:hypothetical protein